MKIYSVTDVGQKRKINEDYTYVSETPVGNLPNLFVVADGMGGHKAGDFASSFAVRVLVDAVSHDADFNPIKIIRHAIEDANRKLLEEASSSTELAGMGTTVVVATIAGHYAYVANVGDSRLYVLDPGIQQVTRDHSLVQEMVQMGELREEDARNHPDKNIITRALGAKETVDIDFFDLKLQPQSMVLMCSDGLSNMVSDEDIEEIVKRYGDVEERGRALVSRANENGGKDNIAVVLIEPFTNEVEE